MSNEDLQQLKQEYTKDKPWIATAFEEGQYQDAYEVGFKKCLELVTNMPITTPVAEIIIKFQELL